jgi:small multidrug resistance family-3 protein
LRIAAFILAGLFEIGGCYLVWLGQTRPNHVLTVLGIVLLAAFGFVLAQIDTGFPSRTYAAYGGIYVAMALAWMVIMDKAVPDKWDMAGIAVTLAGSAIILFGPRD